MAGTIHGKASHEKGGVRVFREFFRTWPTFFYMFRQVWIMLDGTGFFDGTLGVFLSEW